MNLPKQPLAPIKRHLALSTDAESSERRWRWLLQLAHEDADAAVAMIDEHWKFNQHTPLFWTLYLHDSPEVAYQLALKLKPYRSEFAIEMLATSIRDASAQLTKPDHRSAALADVVDSSCELLAQWTLGAPHDDPQGALLGMACLLQFGNPEAGYWRRIPEECLTTIEGLESSGQARQVTLLAQVAFYAQSSSPVAEMAQLLFGAVVGRLFDAWPRWTQEVETRFWLVCQSLSILEPKYLAFRNRRVAAHPAHPLLGILDERIDALRERLLASDPSAALRCLVSLALHVSNETLTRKHHRILRDEFEARARAFPVDAGLALKELIQYVGFSQPYDEMYRRELCQASFDALLPTLARISSTDAAVARSGIGWSPRPPDL